jgi:hypothetical protein
MTHLQMQPEMVKRPQNYFPAAAIEEANLRHDQVVL